MINFELDEEQKLIRDTVVSFAREEIRPHAREADESGSIPAALIQHGWDLGLVQSIIPEEYGGFGNQHSALTGAVVAEELAFGDLSIAMHLLAPRLITVPLVEFGSAALKSALLPRFAGPSFEPGSAAVMEPRFGFDPGAPATTIRREGDDYVLQGEKCYVPLGAQSECFLVLAGFANGGGKAHPQAVIVSRDTPGLGVGAREKNMGLKALETTALTFDACKVPRENVLADGDARAFRRLADLWRVGLAAMAVGVARAAYDYARDYAKERRAFGQAIAQKQAIAFMLAEMAMEVDAMRLLTWEAAWKLDRHEDATREAYLAKRYAGDMALKITDNAVQILGGHGYIRDHLVELFLRNARGFATFEGLAIAEARRQGERTMIDYELSPDIAGTREQLLHMLAEHAMRPIAREYDEREHEKPWDFINMMWQLSKSSGIGPGASKDAKAQKSQPVDAERNLRTVVAVEELSWGDAGLYLAIPGPGLGGAAVMAVGTPEQKQRFLSRFKGDKPVWSAMAITEPGAGSDSAAIQATAVRDGDHWVLNGTKIFCTSGLMAGDPTKSNGFVVVWATLDRSAGRAGIKSFIVDAGTPGMTVAKCEDKLGIRASDTATLIFEDCRIPLDNILGSPEVPKTSEGFKGVMATFDATRPIVAASAIGVGRAALDFVRDELTKQGIEIHYGASPSTLTAIERDFMDMEAQLQAARLLTWRAAWMMDQGQKNNLEASMAKAKAGLVVTQVTQKAVEMLGPLGYSRQLLLEKWMRDAKINDIFEGTQQINMMIIARRILGYSSRELS